MSSTTIAISRRGTCNPDVWWAALGVVPFTAFGTLLLTSHLPPWASAASSLSAGLGVGGVMALIAYAFCRHAVIAGASYTESMSCLGWQLWQETYAAGEIDSLSIEGLYFSDEMQLPYAYRCYLRLRNGVSLKSFIFAKKPAAEAWVQQVNSSLQLERHY